MNHLPIQSRILLSLVKRSVSASGAVALVISLASCASLQVPAGENLKGTWAQTGAGFERGRPVNWVQTVVIEKADGQGFAGFKKYSQDGGPVQQEVINGVIGVDGHVLFVDDDGMFQGRLINGRIMGQYAEVGKDATAVNLVLTRQ
jgi:hypothetical protein